MKKFYFLLIALCLFTEVNAQVINFPDYAFENLLVSSRSFNTIAKDLSGNYFAIDANQNSLIEQDEALNVSALYIQTPGSSDLSGIEYFINLQTLDCSYSSSLTSLDVSGLMNLKALFCFSTPQFSYLNVSGATNLVTLNCRNSALTSLDVSGLTNLRTLECSGSQLTTLNASGASNLIELNCTGNQITTLNTDGLTALLRLNCFDNQISALNVSSSTNLQDLYCWRNQLSSLNLNGLTALENIRCGYNQLTSLIISPSTNLRILDCGWNQMSSLTLSGLSNLEELYCHNNMLTTINVSGLLGLQTLTCRSNQLQSLDISMLPVIAHVECSNNLITTLNLSNRLSLLDLDCSNNMLTSLDVNGLNNLEALNCENNQIISINLNGLLGLVNFNCGFNQLTNIDLSGTANLYALYCNNNQLQSIDVSESNSLDELFCNDNPLLMSVFMKNGREETNVNLQNNPILEYICTDESQLGNVQGVISQLGYTNCNVNTYCSFVPGGVNYTINGYNRFDSDNNGCDVTDVGYSNLSFSISDGTNNGTFSNASGNYSIPVQAGTHTITPFFENPAYFAVSPLSTIVEFPTETSPFTQDFCVTANGVHPDLEVTLLPLIGARPGFDATYKLIYKNKGTNTQSGTLNLSFDDAALDFVSAFLAVTNQTVNNLSWDFVSLQPFETREVEFTINVNSPMEIPAVNSGDVLNYTASITSAATDETPADNTFILNQTVVNSFDPNDKTCLEGTTIAPSEVGKYVHYMIRFENTGTFPAENIVVKDMIDTAKFDINSLVPMKGSHSFVTNITAGNKVEFIFQNINLPFDDANNDGYVLFKIKTLPTLVNGDAFSNSASIYFDYNFPIVTNTAVTAIQALSTQDFSFGSYFSLYLNPVKDIINIETKQNIEVSSISIYNQLGQLVLVVPNAQNVSKVDVSSLSSGNYFLKINSDKGVSNTKFIKQ